jgi:hypothetical protein
MSAPQNRTTGNPAQERPIARANCRRRHDSQPGQAPCIMCIICQAAIFEVDFKATITPVAPASLRFAAKEAREIARAHGHAIRVAAKS